MQKINRRRATAAGKVNFWRIIQFVRSPKDFQVRHHKSAYAFLPGDSMFFCDIGGDFARDCILGKTWHISCYFSNLGTIAVIQTPP